MADWQEIGPGFRIRVAQNAAGEEVGIIESHERPDGGGHCNGYVNWGEPTKPRWQVVQREPLTLTPSIRCLRCGKHGWIRNGRWEEAGA